MYNGGIGGTIMSYVLPSDLEQAFSLHIGEGSYANMEEVLRTALSALNFRDAELAAIQEGNDAFERGEARPLEEFDREFRLRKNIPLDL
jgi:Arc/MetJ-type ribon-helix-helix transcriptional regulator